MNKLNNKAEIYAHFIEQNKNITCPCPENNKDLEIRVINEFRVNCSGDNIHNDININYYPVDITNGGGVNSKTNNIAISKYADDIIDSSAPRQYLYCNKCKITYRLEDLSTDNENENIDDFPKMINLVQKNILKAKII